jgi:serine/threonine protein kinase/tetratricopeptide (TPR) repeat protein
MDSDSSGKYDLLDRLAEEFAERFRRGERPTVNEYVARYPHLESDLREILPAMVEIERAEGDQRVASTAAPAGEDLPPAQVGDYRIIREVGRGGMGVVYEAEQQSLGRRVALKVLSNQALGNAKSQERFRREARSAARLHHTNIVPVFDVGHEGNTSYYAMQLIAGQSLDQVVEELRRLREAHNPKSRGAPSAGGLSQAAQALLTGRFEPQALDVATPSTEPACESPAGGPPPGAGPATPANEAPPATAPAPSAVLPGQDKLSEARADHRHYFRSVARVGQQTALALAYAHARGVIHRDVKPSNLLLDGSGVVWVTDFGLAKTQDSNLTRTGELPGTLRYMSPERFRGECDARADVYSLGLTLYEMLTLRPAFEGGDQCRLIEQIGHQEPPRPRSLDPQIPRDLETVVLRATEKDPRRRYPSADDLAEDLRRFLADEPVRARRVGLIDRTRRWCRRNPWVAGSVAAVVLVFLSAFAAVNVALWQARQAEALAESRRRDAERNEIEARFQKEQADLGFARARKAVDEYLNQVTDGEALKAAGLQPLRRDLLGSALSFYQEFIRERRDDPALRSDLAAVQLRVSRIQGELGNEEGKKSAAGEAVKLYEALVAGSPDDEEAQLGLIEAYTRANQLAKAVALGEPFEAAHPDSVRAKAQLAEAYNALGTTRSQSADLGGAMQAHERSLRLREQLFQRDPANPDYELGLAIALNNIGVVLVSLERTADALVLYRHSLDHARNLFARRPRDFSVIRLLFRGLNNTSGIEETLGLFEPALKTNQEGLELTQKLMKSDPDVPEHVYFCLTFAFRRAGWLDARDRRGEALTAYRIAVATSESPLLHKFSLMNSVSWVQFAITAARCAELIGQVAKDPSPEDRAEQDRLGALAVRHLHRGLDAGFQNPAFLKSGKELNFLRSRADFQELLTRAEKGAQPRNDATAVAKAPNGDGTPTETGEPRKPTSSAAGGGLARSHARGDAAVGRYALGMAEFRLGQWEKAEKSLLDAQTQYEAILHDDPKAHHHRVGLGRTLIALGDLYRDSRRFPEALRSWIAGRDCLLALLKEVSEQDPLAVEVASVLGPLGAYLVDFIPSEADSALRAAHSTSYVMDPYDQIQYGLHCLMVDDDAGYRRHCEKMLNGYPNKDDEKGRYSGDVAVLNALDVKARTEPSRYLPLAERAAKLVPWPRSEQYINGYLAVTYYRAGKLDKALDRLDFCDGIATFGVKGDDGHTVLARATRALVLHRLGRREEARRALEQALRWYPVLESRVLIQPVGSRILDNELPNTVTLNLLRLFLREACSELTGAAFRVDQWYALRRAWGETNFGRNDRARTALDQAGPIDPNDAGLLAARAFILSRIGDAGRAKEDREAALRIDPDQLLARYDRGRLALAEGRPAAAAEDLVCVLAHLPDDRIPGAARFIVDGLLASSDAAFARAVELRPKDPQLWVARGRYLAWHERWKEAAEAYRRGVESQPIHFDSIEYGCALILADDLEGYRQLCAKMVARLKSPDGRKGVPGEDDSVEIAVEVTALHADSGVDPHVVIDCANAAWGQVPNSMGLCLAAGMARERGGQHEPAITLFRRSIQLYPLWEGRDLNWYGLAIVNGRMGQTEEARYWFDQAEASLESKLRLARSEPTVPPGYWMYGLLEAQVRSKEARGILAGDARPSGSP